MDKMKQYMRSILVTIALLLTTIGTWANGTVVIVKQVNGAEAGETSPGEVQSSVSGTTCTLTVTPANGYYLLGITAVRTIDSNNSQGRTRSPGVDEGSIAVTAVADNPTDLSQTTSYTLTMPDSPYDVEVRANFGTRIGISADYISLNPESVTYDGTAKEPTVIVKIGDTTLTLGTDYTMAYSNNINVPADANSQQPTVTVTGINGYTGTATKTFTISKATGTVSYATATVNKTYGDEAFTNELTITGDGTVAYSTSDEKVATVDANGQVSIVGNGEATITATVTDKEGGNYTYETKTASYLLSIGTEAMEVSATAYTGTYDGEAHTITVTAPEDATIKYGTAEGTYDQTEAPGYTDAGTYTVFYQVTKTNFTTVNGSATVTISQAAGTISYVTVTVNKTFGAAAFTNALTITGDGTVSYASSNTAVATVDEETGEVTIKGSGNATITATVADSKNYTYETKTATYTLVVSEQQQDPPIIVPEPVEPTLSWSVETATVTFGEENPTLPTLNNPNRLDITYTSSDTDVATVDENSSVTILAAGETTISATFDGNDDYTEKTVSYTLTINKGVMDVKAEGFTGVYDGKAHGITVTVTTPEGTTVKFGMAEGTYDLDASPTYTDAGNYTVFYQVTKENFTTVNGSATVSITQAKGAISYAAATVSKTFGDEAFTNELTITGDGTVSYTSSNTDVATVDANGQVSIVGSGEATITATITDGKNYTYETKTATYLLSVDTEAMNVTAEGFTGTYDGEAHGITVMVTAPENATVMYGTTEGAYDLDTSPTYTDAGTYTIFYQVTKDNYTAVKGSAIVIISQAEGTISFAEESVSKTLGDDAFINELTNTGDGTVTYSTSDDTVATVDANGQVTIVGNGEVTITASVSDGTNYTYETKTAAFTLTVNEPEPQPINVYALWIGTSEGMTQVTKENADDIIGDGEKDEVTGEILKSGSFVFNPDNNTLLINYEGNDEQEDISIESRMPELKVYLRCEVVNKVKRIFYNNVDDAEGSEAGKLVFTCEYEHPGKIIIANEDEESAIWGFSSIEYDNRSKLAVIEPDGAKYLDGQMMWNQKDEEGNVTGTLIANIVTIGQVLVPVTVVTIKEEDLWQRDENGDVVTNEDGTPKLVNLQNYITSDQLLITLSGDNEDETFDNTDGYSGLAMANTMTDKEVEDIANQVASGDLVPGGSAYAEEFNGVTFMVEPGEGTIILELKWEEGYEYHLQIGESFSPIAIKSGSSEVSEYELLEDGYVRIQIKYDLEMAAYCLLYLVKTDTGARSIDPIGRRDKAHGKVVSISVNITKKAAGNPPSEVSGGSIPGSEDPDDNDDTGIRTVTYHKVEGNDRWYNLNGQQIDEPTKPGLYIHNRKKIFIK